ncbi:MAG: hypothetical protein AAFY10_14140, partial [Pseudomonadota bacterium]
PDTKPTYPVPITATCIVYLLITGQATKTHLSIGAPSNHPLRLPWRAYQGKFRLALKGQVYTSLQRNSPEVSAL